MVTRHTDAHVINAGDGKHQHPTQSLLDLYTIRKALGGVEGLQIAIVGDVLHSRVARSNIQAMRLMGAQVTLVGPPALIPREAAAMGVRVSHQHRRHRRRRRRLRAADAARADAGGRQLRALAAGVQRALGGHAGAGAPQPAGDAPGPDQPRRRDLGRGGRQRQLANRRPGAGRPGDPDGGALRPAHRAHHQRRPGRPATRSSRPDRRWPDGVA